MGSGSATGISALSTAASTIASASAIAGSGGASSSDAGAGSSILAATAGSTNGTGSGTGGGSSALVSTAGTSAPSIAASTSSSAISGADFDLRPEHSVLTGRAVPIAPAAASAAAPAPAAVAIALAGLRLAILGHRAVRLINSIHSVLERRLGPAWFVTLVRTMLAAAVATTPATATATAPAAFVIAALAWTAFAVIGVMRRLGIFGLIHLVLVFDLGGRRLRQARRRRFASGVGAQPLEAEIRWDQRVVLADRDAQAIARLELRQQLPLLVENVECDRGWDIDADFGRAAARALFLDRPQYVEGG